ncbi:MAG: DNA recombination protein RmuC [Holosporales bacterium]|jgi:DNA recombination protein RmuC|nr:DNA recombination protein RmuC [Holosporales bacterium]
MQFEIIALSAAGVVVCGLSLLLARSKRSQQLCLLAQTRLAERCEMLTKYETQNQRLQETLERLRLDNATLNLQLEQKEKIVQEKIDLLKRAEQQFTDTFKALSANALNESNKSFLELAKASLEKLYDGAKADMSVKEKSMSDLVKPIKDALGKVDINLQELEKKRIGAYESLSQQVTGLLNTEHQLRSETSKLVAALKNPTTRGRWGEVQLRRVVEIAGMTKYCDFEEQKSNASDANGLQRPDMTINLPENRKVIVDSKTPLSSYLQALETTNTDMQANFLQEHARHTKKHITSLASKDYLANFNNSLDFVVMFIPGESFLSAALEHDPDLLEYAMSKNVILTAPMTLLALLRSVERGWQQVSIAENSREILTQGRELYKRLNIMVDHFVKLGKSLNQTNGSYNDMVASFECRIRPCLKKITQLSGHSSATDRDIPLINQTPKVINISAQKG